MRIHTMIATDLEGYFHCVNRIRNFITQDKIYPPVLWFRGLSDYNHPLIPSLFRTKTHVHRNMNGDYSQLHYAEDIRTQHYIAKNYHFFQTEPSSRIEWLEVMQHHGIKTRVLDWSESSIHALLFAIEAFLDEAKSVRPSNVWSVPCVWVLEPGTLNKEIFQYISRGLTKNKIKTLFHDLGFSGSEITTVLKRFLKFSELNIYDETEETKHIDYILNLSEINDEIMRDRERIRKLLLAGDVINPYYYILSRIYSDGHILHNRDLPPLAVVHPYHSERIKAQHGVFTVFPFYEEHDQDEDLRNMGLNPDAMERNRIAGSVLHQIIVNNPKEIAYELMQNGMNDSWLYPEMPIVSSEIENRKIYS